MPSGCGKVSGSRGLHKDPAWASYRPELYFLGVGDQFQDLVKRRKIHYVDAEHAPEEHLVARNLWPSLSARGVASPASHAALDVGGLCVHSFGREKNGNPV